MVCATINPVESVLFLIISFGLSAAILFLFHIEFFGLILIIIYVGAIAVLFLFVIMMINIKSKKPNLSFYGYAIFFYFLSEIIWEFTINPFIQKIFVLPSSVLIHREPTTFFLIENLNNIDILGQGLFNYFLIPFLLTGLILLVALIGSIVLTLRFNSSKENQYVHRQLSRTDNFLSFFK